MATVERTERLSPLAEAFLSNFQYTLGFLDRVAFSEAIFNRASHNLHDSLTALLQTQPEVVLQARDRTVTLDGTPLPDSYVLQRIFMRFNCPPIRFRKGLRFEDLIQSLRQMESLLRRELAPSTMTVSHKQDQHYDWLMNGPDEAKA